MKHLRTLAYLAVALVGVGALFAVASVGCSSSSNPPPSTKDGGREAATETGGPEAQVGDAPSESATTDSTMPADSGAPTDSGVPADSEVPTDSGTLTDSGALTDSGFIVPDSGIIVPMDASVAQYAPLVAAAICDRIAACCGTAGDASTFGWGSCTAYYLAQGFNGSNAGAALVEAGTVTENPAQAQDCVSAIEAISCPANAVSAAQETQLFATCFGAFTGTVAAGAPCATTLECVPGTFCNPGADASSGTCQALVDAGGPCGQYGAGSYNASQAICSYLGSGGNGTFCNFTNAADQLLPPTSWTCEPQKPVDAGCNRNQDCTTLLCDPGLNFNLNLCVTSEPWVIPSVCGLYVSDGGDGG